jgi:endogenous inhibitor of DNA gyrase (YacG/DUF329 family)
MDLGRWASEEYRLAGEKASSSDRKSGKEAAYEPEPDH